MKSEIYFFSNTTWKQSTNKKKKDKLDIFNVTLVSSFTQEFLLLTNTHTD